MFRQGLPFVDTMLFDGQRFAAYVVFTHSRWKKRFCVCYIFIFGCLLLGHGLVRAVALSMSSQF